MLKDGAQWVRGCVMPDWLLQLVGQLFHIAIWPLLAPLVLVLLYWPILLLWRYVAAYRLVAEARKAVARTQDGNKPTEGSGFWLKQPAKQPPNYDTAMGASIPIVMVGTLKGGVGKTTLSANLAAHYAIRWRNRRGQNLSVLLIDLDFQGSLSTMTLASADGGEMICRANRLVSGELSGGRLTQEAQPVTATGMVAPLSIRTLPASYDLAQAENRSMIEWLLPQADGELLNWLLRVFRIRHYGDSRSKTDLRYRLAEALLHHSVQETFDLVIIDAPPRLTTSHIQAMCASTHVLIPTIIDGLSNDAVAKYLDQIASHKLGPLGAKHLAICPQIEPLGVAFTLIPPNPPNFDGVLNELQAKVDQSRLRPQLLRDISLRTKHRKPYRDCSGVRIAYADTSLAKDYEDLRDEVDTLAILIAKKLGCEARHWSLPEPRSAGWPI